MLPSKLTRSTRRTSYPSRLSRDVVLHVEHSHERLCCGVACIIMLPCPCGQKGRSISTGRFPVDASSVRLFSFVSGSRATVVKGMRCHRFPTRLASFVVHHRVASLLDCIRWMIAVVRFLLHGVPGCLSVRLCPAPTGPPKCSLRCSFCSSSLVPPVTAMPAGCPLVVPWGSTSDIAEQMCRIMPHIARTACDERDVSTV